MKTKSGKVQIAVRLDELDVERLDNLIPEFKGHEIARAMGVTWTRATMLRMVIRQGLVVIEKRTERSRKKRPKK